MGKGLFLVILWHFDGNGDTQEALAPSLSLIELFGGKGTPLGLCRNAGRRGETPSEGWILEALSP